MNKKWTDQQRLLNLCKVIGGPTISLAIISVAVRIGPQDTLELLNHAEKIGSKKAIQILKRESMKIVDLASYKNAI